MSSAMSGRQSPSLLESSECFTLLDRHRTPLTALLWQAYLMEIAAHRSMVTAYRWGERCGGIFGQKQEACHKAQAEAESRRLGIEAVCSWVAVLVLVAAYMVGGHSACPT